MKVEESTCNLDTIVALTIFRQGYMNVDDHNHIQLLNGRCYKGIHFTFRLIISF